MHRSSGRSTRSISPSMDTSTGMKWHAQCISCAFSCERHLHRQPCQAGAEPRATSSLLLPCSYPVSFTSSCLWSCSPLIRVTIHTCSYLAKTRDRTKPWNLLAVSINPPSRIFSLLFTKKTRRRRVAENWSQNLGYCVVFAKPPFLTSSLNLLAFAGCVTSSKAYVCVGQTKSLTQSCFMRRWKTPRRKMSKNAGKKTKPKCSPLAALLKFRSHAFLGKMTWTRQHQYSWLNGRPGPVRHGPCPTSPRAAAW
jgi:hypothetical protein